ncbi:unnamed protein product [Diabrotica balteata]|uniref:Origin recognition complex subunit 3 n=1 Tax=Diabrotica balteata TaxID=107213 RepID=A0A9N9XBS0_DIABA|nr:unnamed protein product [Diabrotica balteata]
MEDNQTVSVSKGVFVFKNNFKPPKQHGRRKKKILSKGNNNSSSFFSCNLWYQHYYSLWNVIEEQIDVLNYNLFSSVLSNLIDFVKTSHNDTVKEIPTAALFTGINMPDHAAQFAALSKQLKESITPHVATLNSQNCQNIKYFMENMIGQFINDDEYLDEDENESGTTQIKKTQLTMSLLESWYEKLIEKKPLVVIIPDFESFNPQVLERFILIISCFSNLPFVLVLGIATDMNTLHSSLPYKVSSKIRVRVFNSQKSIEYLNNVLENVFFTDMCPFQIGGKVFNLFMEVFLFYDLSVRNFIQNIKYACADHFTFGNAMTLCHLSKDVIVETLDEFTSDDFASIRQLSSFKKLVQNTSRDLQGKLLVNDDYLSEVMVEKICEIQQYINNFHLFLKCLLVLVEDLPRTPLGKHVRELYAVATSRNITQTADYKECMKLLTFQSKDELSGKLQKISGILQSQTLHERDGTNEVFKLVTKCINDLDNIDQMDESEENMEVAEETENPVDLKVDSRGQFRKKLLELSKHQNRSLNKYEKLREQIIAMLSSTFEKYLKEPECYYFHEIFFYNDMSIKNYIIGQHRSAIHNALNDPHFYLRCKCCETANSTSIKPSMPDISIAYKLHLEYGKMINLYDWLQSFVSIVDPEIVTQGSSKMVVKPELQARFTQAVAELEYLGFIKSSKRKTDHVQRLTWGG